MARAGVYVDVDKSSQGLLAKVRCFGAIESRLTQPFFVVRAARFPCLPRTNLYDFPGQTIVKSAKHQTICILDSVLLLTIIKQYIPFVSASDNLDRESEIACTCNQSSGRIPRKFCRTRTRLAQNRDPQLIHFSPATFSLYPPQPLPTRTAQPASFATPRFLLRRAAISNPFGYWLGNMSAKLIQQI